MKTDQSVGDAFNSDLLKAARDKTLAVVEDALKLLKPGVSEDEIKQSIDSIAADHGIEKRWHPPQIRFGENTMLPFGVPGIKNNVLKENDIAFIDLGLIYQGHEGDVGRAIAIGNDPDMKSCCEDAEELWHIVRDHWEKTGATGKDLYAFATQKAEARGWVLSLKKANGHRISDFPHIVRARGTIIEVEEPLKADRWILEIQILHPEKKFGAFYEDLLN